MGKIDIKKLLFHIYYRYKFYLSIDIQILTIHILIKMVLEYINFKIISNNQSAFLFGRVITDNRMIRHERIHMMRKKWKEKEDLTALKLDMSKAYDRVKWGFLRLIMLKLGFHVRWIEIIMDCISPHPSRF